MNKKYFDSRKGSVEATINTIRSEQKTIVKEEPKVSLQPKSYFGQKKDSLADVAAKVVSVNENIEVYITKKGSGPVNKRSIVKDFNNKAEAEKWIKWYKTGNMKDVESIKLFDLAKAMKYMDNRPIDEATRPDPTQYGPDKVAKAMKIAVKSDGNYTGAVKEIEKIAKDLSKVSTIARALKTANEDYKSDYEKEQPIKVKKAIEIAKRMAGNYTGATKEIEKLAKGLSQLPVVKSVLMRVNESNDMGFWVKFAKKKDGKIETAWYRSKEDAEKALASLKKDGLNGIISKGRMDEEAPANATGTAVAGTGDDSSTVVVRKKKKKELQSKLMRRLKIKETIDRAIPDLEYPKDPIRERTEQLKGFAKEYTMGLQVPSTSYMKPTGDLNKGKPLRKREMTMDVIPQGELKPLKKKNEISNRLKSKVLKRKIDRAKTKMLSKKRLQQP
jgi:hypothetical protein